jgi:hypothetical protein
MAEKESKFTNNLLDVVQLLNENELKSEMGEAFAAFMLNPTVTWAKFILTDDRTNANGERIPKEEFKNLMKSGIHMPIKMAMGEISPGHPETKPLGTITHLKEVSLDGGISAIVAIAALWGQERPADVEFIKTRFASKLPVDVSWEILYEDAKLNAQLGSMDLEGTVLRAATIVGNPAYQGRTPFLSIAAKKVSKAEEEPATNSETTISEEALMDTKELEARVAELEPQLSEVQTKLTQSETLLTEKENEITRLTEENTAKETELVTLREYKASIEAETARVEKLEQIKTKFVEAGLTKDDEYFNTNSDKFFKMDDDSLSFFIQEMAAGLTTEAGKNSQSSTKETKIPALLGDEGEDKSVKSLAKALREQRKK